MDDASSEIYSAIFVDEEGTMSTFTALEEVISEQGLFCGSWLSLLAYARGGRQG